MSIKNYFHSLALIALLICSIMLGLALYTAGPRVRSVEYDMTPRGTISQAARRITVSIAGRLTQNQQLKITSYPTLQVSAAVLSENKIDIELNESLLSSTDYNFIINDVRDQKGKTRSLSIRVRTDDTFFINLQRSYEVNTNDVVIKHSIHSGAQQKIFEAEKITVVAATPYSVMAVSSVGDFDTGYVVANDHPATDINLPYGKVTAVAASSTNDLYVITVENNYIERFYAYTTVDKKFTELMDINNKPICMTSYSFTPDGTTLIYKSIDSIYYLYDLQTPQPPLPIGDYLTYSGFTYDSKAIVMGDYRGILLLDSKGSIDYLKQPLVDSLLVQPLLRRPDLFITYTTEIGSKTDSSQVLSIVSKNSVKKLVEIPYKTAYIQLMPSNLNGEYIAYEQFSKIGDSASDDYHTNNKPKNTETVIMDHTGEIIKTISGTGVFIP